VGRIRLDATCKQTRESIRQFVASYAKVIYFISPKGFEKES
jgi:hypothetical protein